MPISASAETKISVDQIVTESADLISVPIRIEGNTGICGAALSIKYDKNLILKGLAHIYQDNTRLPQPQSEE